VQFTALKKAQNMLRSLFYFADKKGGLAIKQITNMPSALAGQCDFARPPYFLPFSQDSQ